MKLHSAEPILSVSQLTAYIRQLFETNPIMAKAKVAGELSNFRRHSSGHCYFTLKDAASSLRCVMFRNKAQLLRFVPRDGQQVRLTGTVSVYERDGAYQLYVESMTDEGEGDLALAFARLKEKLLAEGLFDAARKKALPLLPRAVGIVTSQTSAVLRDIISVAARRHPGIPLLLANAQVQGEGAGESIVRAIRLLDRSERVDVLIVGRGGGSMEELWAFNEEKVVRAVAAARKPVVSAVGHQTDFTLTDFAADIRAATPSQAAEFVVPDLSSILQRIGMSRQRLNYSLKYRLSERRLRLERCLRSSLFRRPRDLLRERAVVLDQLSERLQAAIQGLVQARRNRLELLQGKMTVLNPLGVLQRGYSVVLTPEGQIVKSAEQVLPGEQIEILLRNGTLAATVTGAGKARNG